MAGRVLAGKSTNSNLGHSSGVYGLFVSAPGKDITTCTDDQLLFTTDNGATGSNFISKGFFQIAPVSGGTSNTAPVVKQTDTVAAGATTTTSLTNIFSAGSSAETIAGWGGFSPSGGGEDGFRDTFKYTGTGATSRSLTNDGSREIVVDTVFFNMFVNVSAF